MKDIEASYLLFLAKMVGNICFLTISAAQNYLEH